VKSQPAKSKADANGYYTVKKGDTLLHIALEFGQNYRDLIVWNNLENPNDIKIDQVLRVIPPDSGIAGVQVGAVNNPSAEVKPVIPLAGVPMKNQPKGDKKPYSDAALAEMQKPDPSIAAVSPPVKPEDKPAVKPADKPADAAGGEEKSIAWVWPAEGAIISSFEDSKKGIDIAGKVGQPVYVAAPGKVMYAGSGIRGYGNLIVVRHTNTVTSVYAHNSNLLVKEEQMVTRGQKIAEMGSTDAESVRLHFEIRKQGKPVDPTKLLPSR
jgi:lipoprotein NlpD